MQKLAYFVRKRLYLGLPGSEQGEPGTVGTVSPPRTRWYRPRATRTPRAGARARQPRSPSASRRLRGPRDPQGPPWSSLPGLRAPLPRGGLPGTPTHHAQGPPAGETRLGVPGRRPLERRTLNRRGSLALVPGTVGTGSAPRSPWYRRGRPGTPTAGARAPRADHQTAGQHQGQLPGALTLPAGARGSLALSLPGEREPEPGDHLQHPPPPPHHTQGVPAP